MQLNTGATLLGGKYKIEKMLGQGGFGITYLATQKVVVRGEIGEINTEIKVAIKEFFMKDSCNRDPQTSVVSVPSQGSVELVNIFKKKFVKEAQNISLLKHQNIVKVLDVFEENDTAYYVMEYLDSGSLDDYIKQRGALNQDEALRYIGQLASALQYIHVQQFNHLDIKPGNVLLRADGSVVLIDFGLAKRYDKQGNQTSATPVGISAGYAPMEQYNEGGVGQFSPSTDIYSLGATLYKLLTGKVPPVASLVLESGLPEMPNSISQKVQKAILKAMEPRRANRPQSVEEFMLMLDIDISNSETQISDALLESEATMIIPPAPKSAPAQPATPQPAQPKPVQPKPVQPKPVQPKIESSAKPQEAKKSNKKIIIIVSALVGVVALIIILSGLGSSTATEVFTSADYKILDSPTEIAISEEVYAIAPSAFSETQLEYIELPNTLTEINEYAFYECDNLTEIVLPESLIKLDAAAFADCDNLIYIDLPGSLVSIGDMAFAHCWGLTTIDIPNSVKSLGESVFYNCKKLQTVTIPESVETIGDGLFEDCKNLRTIKVAESSPVLKKLQRQYGDYITVY